MNTLYKILSLILLVPACIYAKKLSELPQINVKVVCGKKLVDLSRKNLTDISGIGTLEVKYKDAVVPLSEVDDLSLNLSQNELVSLPIEISQLANLTELKLAHNKLTALPDSIGSLSNLILLDLESNKLQAIPESIGQLTNLIHLNLKWNPLSSLPNSIWQLTKLVHLDLARTRLEKLSADIQNLTNLEYLCLSHTPLKQLPLIELSRLVNLTEFWIHANILSSIRSRYENAFLRVNKTQGEIKQVHPWYKKPLSEWEPQMTPITCKKIHDITYKYLDLSDKELTDIQHISKLLVYDMTESDEAKKIKPITDIENLYIDLSRNSIVKLPLDMLYMKVTTANSSNLSGIDLSHNYTLDDIGALSGINLLHLNLYSCKLLPADSILKVLNSAVDADEAKLIDSLQTLNMIGTQLYTSHIEKLIGLLNRAQNLVDCTYEVFENGVPVLNKELTTTTKNIIKRNKTLYSWAFPSL